MVREDKSTWKSNYFSKLTNLLDEYPKCFIVGADNVGSKQMQVRRFMFLCIVSVQNLSRNIIMKL